MLDADAMDIQASDKAANKEALPRRIALLGMMGAGKSSVGHLLAERLGCRFIDLDALIADFAQMSIGDIFARHGEEGFRKLEACALAFVLAYPCDFVLATGGGTPMDPISCKRLLEETQTVYLHASVNILATRLEAKNALGAQEGIAARPLLSTRVSLTQKLSTQKEEPKPLLARLEALYRKRCATYARADVRIDTENLDPKAVVAAIEAAGIKSEKTSKRSATPKDEVSQAKISVRSATHSYSITLASKMGAWFEGALRPILGEARICVVSDHTVDRMHGKTVEAGLQAAGFSLLPSWHTAPGESSKSMAALADLHAHLLRASVQRKDVLLALGGGVVGDLCGFAASTVLRGIRCIQMPTTVLALVDSSVGGKTGINTPFGKNLVGSFWPPHAVLASLDFLHTLPRDERSAGWVEALKMGLTHEISLVEDIARLGKELLDGTPKVVLQVAQKAIAIKAGVVMRDEKELGERAVLNLGHTVGHAIESAMDFKILHGHAVGLGMLAELEWGCRALGRNDAVWDCAQKALLALEAPTDWRAHPMDMSALDRDKKRCGEKVKLTDVPEVGKHRIWPVVCAELVRFLQPEGSG